MHPGMAQGFVPAADVALSRLLLIFVVPCVAVSFRLPIRCTTDGLSVPDSRAKPPSYNVAPSQASLHDPSEPRDRRAQARSAALGPDPARMHRPRWRPQADQREGRIGGAPAELPRGLCKAPLHRPRRLLFRVARDQGAARKAALCRRNERSHTVRSRRAVGELASSAKRRMDSHQWRKAVCPAGPKKQAVLAFLIAMSMLPTQASSMRRKISS